MKLSSLLISLGTLILWLALAFLLMMDHISGREWVAIILQMIFGFILMVAGGVVYESEKEQFEKMMNRTIRRI